MVKKIFKICLFVTLIFSALIIVMPQANSQVLKASIESTDRIPEGFYGTWQVYAFRKSSTNPQMFAPYSIELWNLSSLNGVITLCNPISGAEASINIKEVNGNSFVFTRVTGEENEKVTETAELILEGDIFSGFDTMVVDRNNSSDKVVYQLKAQKISGNTISKFR